jgi:hypothetical protein
LSANRAGITRVHGFSVSSHELACLGIDSQFVNARSDYARRMASAGYSANGVSRAHFFVSFFREDFPVNIFADDDLQAHRISRSEFSVSEEQDSCSAKKEGTCEHCTSNNILVVL